jgi:hypothetical protein
MVIDHSRRNGIYYINKNKELGFAPITHEQRNILGQGSVDIYTAIPTEKYLVVGLVLFGENILIDYYAEINSVYRKNALRSMSDIENFLAIQHTNVFFKIADSQYRTENTPFTFRVSKVSTDFY